MGRYPENTGIKDLILLGRTSESTPRFLREGNETCERFLHMISAEAVDKEEELCLFSREQR